MFGGYPSRLIQEGSSSVSWNQRLAATDLDYSLVITTNLLMGDWEPLLEGTPLTQTPQGDGVMERVGAGLLFDVDPLY